MRLTPALNASDPANMWTAWLVVGILAADGAPSDETREKLVVMPLQLSGLPQESVAIMDELLTNAVRDVGQHDVIGKSDVDSMLQAEGSTELACDDLNCAVEIGGALGARFLLSGRVAKLGDNLIIVLKLIDATAQKVVNSIKHKALNEEGTHDIAIRDAVSLLFGLKSDVPVELADSVTDPMRRRISNEDWRAFVFHQATSGELISLTNWVQDKNRESTALMVGEWIAVGVFFAALSASTTDFGTEDDWPAMIGAAGLFGLGTLLVVDLLDFGSVVVADE